MGLNLLSHPTNLIKNYSLHFDSCSYKTLCDITSGREKGFIWAQFDETVHHGRGSTVASLLGLGSQELLHGQDAERSELGKLSCIRLLFHPRLLFMGQSHPRSGQTSPLSEVLATTPSCSPQPTVVSSQAPQHRVLAVSAYYTFGPHQIWLLRKQMHFLFPHQNENPLIERTAF